MIERLLEETCKAENNSALVLTNDFACKVALKNAYISAATPLHANHIIGKIGESTIATLGNFSAIIGKAKSRKTFCLSALVASAHSGNETCGFCFNLPSDRPNILYFDTEQSTYHIVKLKRRINHQAGCEVDHDYSNLEVYQLRKYSPEERVTLIDHAINMATDVSLVVIDGLRDLIYDINNPGESTTIISKLMKWTEEKNIHICTVLHQNKGDENARGHIGTELVNKAETILKVEKDRQNHDISCVSAIYVRDREFEPFAFGISQNGTPELTNTVLSSSLSSEKPNYAGFDPQASIPTDVHCAALKQAFDGNASYGWSQLKSVLCSAYSKQGIYLGSSKLMKTIAYLKEKGLICQHEGKKYSLNSEALNALRSSITQ